MNLNLEDIRIKQSGLCEKYKCSVKEIKELFQIWNASSFGSKQTDKVSDSFILLMSQLSGNLSGIRVLFEKELKRHKELLLEIEIKKSAGTYDEWIKEIEKENKEFEPFMTEFFKAFSKIVEPVKTGNFN